MISPLLLAANLCDLDPIYDRETFSYFLPRELLESYLDGNAFDHKVRYTPSERSALEEDINAIFQMILEKKSDQEKIAVIAVGALGAGKTILMLQDQIRKKFAGEEFAYIEWDDVCLKQMERTYLKDLRESDEIDYRQAVYDKWKPGSNAACHLILANLIRENRAFYFGTPVTSEWAARFFQLLKTQDYKIRLLHITANDDVRWGSILERDKEFVQTTERDLYEEGLLFPQRIQDTYLQFADTIQFYYRKDITNDAILAAKWHRIGSTDLGNLKVQNKNAYEGIQKIHDSAVRHLGREDLLWSKTVGDASISRRL